ncbi:MAG: ERF family protein [Ruminococcus sp.]|nr:ERF family protein [Ruminococcus sp.]
MTGVPGSYIKAVARFIDCATGTEITTHAFAKECSHKGMSEDQCTGTASSYARKYALNALLLIDDTKDSDSDEVTGADRSNDGNQNNNGGY